MDQSASRRHIGVGLILRAQEEKAGELAGLFGGVDLRQVFVDALKHLWRRVKAACLVEIGLRRFERPHAEIQHPELEIDSRQVGVEQQHALERRYRGLVVAELRRDIGIGEGDVEIGGVAQHLLEQSCFFCFERAYRSASWRHVRAAATSSEDYAKITRTQAKKVWQAMRHHHPTFRLPPMPLA